MDAERDRVTVQEAAQRLGVSEQAVRKRVKRGTLESKKEGDGRVYVYLDAGQDEDRDGVPPPDSTALISAKDETIGILRDQLTAEREAHAEARRIIAGMVQRLPALDTAESREEAQQPPQETREDAGEGQITQDTPRRPWWQFW